MAQILQAITPELKTFIEKQPLFFVASAPLDPEGHVNLSPKGLDTLRLLSPNRIAYMDLTGSGNETSAHLAENGRITFMFCAFAGPPCILRLYGHGRTILPGTSEWEELAGKFPDYPGRRQIILADITLVQTSCGFGVPLMKYRDQRQTLVRWARTKKESLDEYRTLKNSRSIDGLPTPLGTQSGTTNPDPETNEANVVKGNTYFYDFQLDGMPTGYFEWREEGDILFQNVVFEMDDRIIESPFRLRHNGRSVSAYQVGNSDWIKMPPGMEGLYPTSAWILLLRMMEDELEYESFFEGSGETLGRTILRRESDMIVESRNGAIVRRFKVRDGVPVWIDWGGATSTLKSSLEEATAGIPPAPEPS